MASYPIVAHFPDQLYSWFTLVRFDPTERKYHWEPISSEASIPLQLIPDMAELLALQGISYHILYHSSKEVH